MGKWYMRHLSNKSSGLTLVELAVVIVVAGIISGIIFTVMYGYYTSNINSLVQSTQDTDTRRTLRMIENELVSADGFKSSITGLSSPLGSNNATANWSYTGIGGNYADRRVLIAATYATTIDRANDTNNLRQPVFVDDGSGCDYSKAKSLKNARIYFLADPQNVVDAANGNYTTYTLYRRTIVGIKPTSGTYAQSNYCYGSQGQPIGQKTTCASSVVAANPSICKGSDALLMKNVEKFRVEYYPTDNSTTQTSSVDTAKSAILKLTARQRSEGGEQKSEDFTIRISLPQ